MAETLAGLLSNISIWCPVALEVHPLGAAEVDAAIVAWADGHGLLGEASGLRSINLGLLVAAGCPFFSAEALVASGQFYLWAFCVDDRDDADPDVDAIRVADMMRAFTECNAVSLPDDLLVVAARDASRRIGRALPLLDRARFGAVVAQWISCQVWKTAMAWRDRLPSVGEYLRMRYHKTGVDALGLLAGPGAGYRIDPFMSHAVRAFTSAVFWPSILINDVISLAKELDADEPNIVTLLMRARQISLIEALRDVWELYERLVAVALRWQRTLQSDADPAVVRYATELPQWLSATLHFTTSSARYLSAPTLAGGIRLEPPNLTVTDAPVLCDPADPTPPPYPELAWIWEQAHSPSRATPTPLARRAPAMQPPRQPLQAAPALGTSPPTTVDSAAASLPIWCPIGVRANPTDPTQLDAWLLEWTDAHGLLGSEVDHDELRLGALLTAGAPWLGEEALAALGCHMAWTSVYDHDLDAIADSPGDRAALAGEVSRAWVECDAAPLPNDPRVLAARDVRQRIDRALSPLDTADVGLAAARMHCGRLCASAPHADMQLDVQTYLRMRYLNSGVDVLAALTGPGAGYSVDPARLHSPLVRAFTHAVFWPCLLLDDLSRLSDPRTRARPNIATLLKATRHVPLAAAVREVCELHDRLIGVMLRLRATLRADTDPAVVRYASELPHWHSATLQRTLSRTRHSARNGPSRLPAIAPSDAPVRCDPDDRTPPPYPALAWLWEQADGG